LLALITTQAARADSLVTGAIRDQAGAAIAGARVTAYDAAGHAVGTDVAIVDGTFAIAARAPAVQVAIACDYCRSVRRTLETGQPVVVIVQRFLAVTASGPAAADLRALPYRSAADIAPLQPFTIVNGQRISDRGLSYEGAVLVDGLPFYRAADADDLSRLVPAHAVAGFAAASPLNAPVYGGYAGAGIYDVRLSDPDLSTSRIDTGDASDIVAHAQTPSLDAGYAASSDSADDRQAASAGATLPFASGRLSFDAVDLADLATHGSGVGLRYATDSRRFATEAAVSATQSDAASLLTANALVRSRGPLQWEYGVRAMRATSTFDAAAGSQFDAALYVRAARQTRVSRLSATLAVDRGDDASIASVANGSRGTALIGSLADDLSLGSRWSAHTGAVSNQRIPTFAELSAAAPLTVATNRTVLFEESVTYTDLRRMRLTALAYTQRATGSATQHVNGIGLDGAWQIAPELSLRTWALRGNSSSISSAEPGPPYDSHELPDVASAPTRGLLWLSYEKGIRFDALVRGGALEGDVRIPLGAYAFSIGTAIEAGKRVTTFGLSLR
jgi:hypothetical protein